MAVWAVPAAVMGALGLWGLNRAMWWDETTTYEVATRSAPDIWALVHHADVVHVLYYLLMHLLLPAGSGDAVLLRLPSVLGMAVAAGATAAVGRRLAGRAVGLGAGLLLAVTPLASHYAQEGRSYGLVTGLVTVACLLLLRAVERPTVRRWVAYGSVVLLASLLHLFAALILAAHGFALAAGRIPRRTLHGWLITALAVAACLSPFALYAHTQIGQLSLLPRPGWRQAAGLIRQFSGPRLPAVAVVVPLAALGALRSRRGKGPLTLRTLAVPWLVLPAGVLLAGSLIQPAFNPRYVLYSLPALSLLTAAGPDGLARAAVRPRRGGPPVRGRRLVPRVVGAALAGVLLVLQWPTQEWLRTPASRNDDQTAVARVIGQRARTEDAIVFVPGTKRNVEYVYAADFTRTDDVLMTRSPAASRTLGGEEAPVAEIRRLLLPHRRVWLVDRTVRPGGSAATVAKREVLLDAYRPTTEITARGEVITLYVRGS
ncbi:glycosyltransferase family 39 protein [Streptomyces sp. NPDC001795]|uniref:glycosyltransferase family 39 protein n=1 Tax=Streptomyces sp. NPDC001795 TaxID=3154525 RepID=UPI003327E68A